MEERSLRGTHHIPRTKHQAPSTKHHAPRTTHQASRITPHPSASTLPAMSSESWESRYQSGDMPWEKGAPSPGLVDFLAAHPALPRGTVCVPGCGTGHDVRV